MKKQSHADEMKKDLDIMLSKINALEVVASGEYQKGVVKVLRALVEGQVHTINEFEHLKKAIDLLTLQLFETQNKIRS
ncbi:hypothetical protein LCGC14_1665470 [marine sediment metagenome]|jgi:hypothetical protein|uniref:Uncharacterized protein n=1 Tax=marine sediment metagenome TaxID=412755 RepID=A0A0F9K8N0_9ZZZZ|nr:hypothetical protein [Nitrosopumilus sp.]